MACGPGEGDLHRPASRDSVRLELQPFVNSRDVKDSEDEDLTQELENDPRISPQVMI